MGVLAEAEAIALAVGMLVADQAVAEASVEALEVSAVRVHVRAAAVAPRVWADSVAAAVAAAVVVAVAVAAAVVVVVVVAAVAAAAEGGNES